MIRPRLILVGGGGHALSCLDLIAETNEFDLMGYVAIEASSTFEAFGIQFLGNDDDLPNLSKIVSNFHIAIGQIKTARPRVTAFERLRLLQCVLPVIKSADASVSSSASLAEGVMVGRNAVVNSGALIGDNCIINSGAIIEHGVKIGKHCHIAPGAIILGDAVIGECSFVGAGSIVREGVTIAPNSMIGAGERVMRDYV